MRVPEAAMLAVTCLTFLACLASTSGQGNLKRRSAALPSFQSILDKFKPDEIKGVYTLDGCDVAVVATSTCKLTMTSGACFTLEKLIKASLAGTKTDQIVSSIKSPISPTKWKVSEVVIDGCAKTGSISVSTDQAITVIPGIVFLTSFSLKATFTNPIKNYVIEFNGDWKVGKFSFSTKITKDPNGLHLVTTPKTQSTTLANLITSISSGIFPSSVVNTVLSRLRLGSVTVSSFNLIGEKVPDGLAFRLTFKVSIPNLGTSTMYMTYTKPTGAANPVYDVGVDFPTLTLTKLVRSFSSIDISEVPVIKDLAIEKPSVLVTSADLALPIIPFPGTSNLVNMPEIKKGLTAIFGGKFSSSDPAATFVQHFVRPPSSRLKGKLSFSLRGAKPNAKALLQKLLNTFGNVQLPPGFDINSILRKALEGFDYDADTKTLKVPVPLGSRLTLIQKALVLENPQVTFIVNLGTKKIGVEIASQVSFGSVVIDLSFSKPAGQRVFQASGSSGSNIYIGRLVEKFALALLPNQLDPLAKKVGLDAFYISKPAVDITFSKNYALSLRGTTVIKNFDACQVEVLMGRTKAGSLVFATALVMERLPISGVISKITKLDVSMVPGMSLLDRAKIALIMASEQIPENDPNLKMSIPVVNNMNGPILDGLTLFAKFIVPTTVECGRDKFCKILAQIVSPGFELNLEGRLALANIHIKATIPKKIRIISGVDMENMGFELQIGSKTFFGLTMEMNFNLPPAAKLKFIGGVGISTSGVYLKMATKGVWSKPFSIPFLQVADLLLETTFGSSPIGITALQIGGKMTLGVLSKCIPRKHCMEASVYGGVDSVTPSQNYFFANVSSLTLYSIMKAFGTSVNLPSVLQQTGFPEGVLVSVSPETRSLPNGVTIERGVYFKGKFNLLGYELSAKISVSLNGIRADVKADPLNIANGLLSVSGTSTPGPRVFVDLSWNPPRTDVIIQGRVSLLKMKQSADIRINHQGMYMKLSGRMFLIFETTLELKAVYSSLKSASFQVKGTMQQTILRRLKAGVTRELQNFADTASNAIKKEQERVDRQRASLNRARQHLQGEKRKFEAAGRAVAAQRHKIARARRVVNSKKADVDRAARAVGAKNCPGYKRCKRSAGIMPTLIKSKGAKKFLRRKKRWGRWRAPRIRIDLCPSWCEKAKRWARERAAEIARKAARAAKVVACHSYNNVVVRPCRAILSGLEHTVRVGKVGLSIAAGVLRGTEHAMVGLGKAVSQTKHLVSVAQGAIHVASGVLDGYIKTLDGVKAANRLGANVASKIASAALGGILDIRKISFDVKLSAMQSQHFRGCLEVAVFGRRKHMCLTLKLRSMGEIIGELFKQIKNII